MKNGFFSSIRFRAYLLYVFVLAAALFFHNALTYLGYRDSLHRKVDSLLAAKALGVEGALRAYSNVQQSARATAEAQTAAESQNKNWFSELFDRTPKKVFISPIEDDPYEVIFRYLDQETLSPDKTGPRVTIDIYDLKGALTNSSSYGPKPDQLYSTVLRRVLQSEKFFYTMTLKTGKDLHPMRAMATLISQDGAPKEIVQTRLSLQRDLDELRRFAIEMTLQNLIVIVLASGGGFILVHFTLKPVDRMTRTIRNIKPDSLDQRLRVPDTRDEIARLAGTFNGMLERLEKSFHSQKQIVQDISHELKTPLTIIRGQMEVALKKERPVEDYVEILQSSLEEIQKVRLIVDNLLLLAKFDSGSQSLQTEPVHLKNLLEAIVQDTRILGLEKELTVTFTPTTETLVQGNDVHLERVFRNLLENAVKYNVPHGTIDVFLEEDGQNAWVTIRDTGIGIAEAATEKIFDRFYRVDQARSSREGFGLGLSISKSIVEAHQGKIQVESTLGKGTTFRVALPI